jgi:hypothetical protein
MPEGDTGVIGISGCIGEVMALPLFIKPRRKTPGFSHGDRSRVPFFGG